MYREETTTTTRLATEIIRCIAKTLLTKADELERLQDPTQTEPPRPRSYDPAYDLYDTPTTETWKRVRPVLAALGEAIDYDHDYRSECNEQGRNHRGA